MATYVKLIHNGNMKTVAFYEGISSDEVVNLLKIVFGVSGNIVGIMAEKGLVIPLSLMCSSPSIIPNSPCKLLVSSPQQSTVDSIPSRTPATMSIGGSSLQSDEALANSEDSQVMTEDESIQYVTKEITKFLDSLRAQNFLTTLEHRRLHGLLSESSSLLFAAYSVAVSANDSEYMAEICKELATSLATEQGQLACEAQDETLQICDQLYIDEKITENQLLYLRHLTLIRDESVASVYDDFQEHQSVPVFAQALYQLANTHPFQNSADVKSTRATSQQSEAEKDVEEAEDNYLPPPTRRRSITTIAQGLTGVVSLMTRAAVISKTEANVLLEMIEHENDYVIAAYELYEKDKNLDDLQDTLIRCVKLEIRKRVTDIQEQEFEALQQARLEQEKEWDRKEAEQASEDDYNQSEEEEDDEDDGANLLNGGDSMVSDEQSVDFNLEDISLESILSSLNVSNIWKEKVPELFVKTLFIAVFRKQLSVEQASVLCDLFQAKYDFVHSAWEVFTVQGDTADFVDTVKRIITNVVKDDEDDEDEDVKPVYEANKSPAKAAAPSPKKNESSSSTSAAGSSGNPNSPSLNQRKAEALQAVNAAKRELLKHSLEMMVKQGLTGAEQASDLYARYLNGDLLTDAAIETYAADRDVGEFLDTLQVLANNSKEDLDTLMKAVSDEDDKEAESQPSSSAPVSAASSAKSDSTPTASAATVDASSLEDIAFIQIQDIVNEMFKNDMIGPGIKEAFGTLIAYRDQRLVKAFEQYLKTKSGAELVDSLLRIVIATVEDATSKAAVAAATASASAAASQTSTSTSTSPAKPTVPANSSPAKQTSSSPSKPSGASGVLDSSDQKTVIDILLRASAVSRDQHAALTKLIDSRHPALGRIFLAYEEDKDVYALIDALRTLDLSTSSSGATPFATQESTSSKSASTHDSTSVNAAESDDDELDQGAEDEENEDDEEDEEEEEEEEEEDDGEEVDEDDVGTVEEKFMDIIKSMQLSDLETAALRLAIAENDPLIRLAIDRFRQDLDESRLMDTMRTAARGVITRTLTARMLHESRGIDEEDDEDDAGEDVDDEDFDEEEEDVSEARSGSMNISTRAVAPEEEIEEENAEDDDEENDEDDDDEDDDGEDGEDDPGSSLLLSQSARDHVFPILVQELVKENIISGAAGKIIATEFLSGNPVISTALDLYDLDQDMAQLVESLQELVANIQQTKQSVSSP